MTAHEDASFAAGQDCGTRVAACIARLAALELIEGARWWSRWRRRLQARALIACAEDLERSADASRRVHSAVSGGPDAGLTLRLVKTDVKAG